MAVPHPDYQLLGLHQCCISAAELHTSSSSARQFSQALPFFTGQEQPATSSQHLPKTTAETLLNSASPCQQHANSPSSLHIGSHSCCPIFVVKGYGRCCHISVPNSWCLQNWHPFTHSVSAECLKQARQNFLKSELNIWLLIMLHESKNTSVYRLHWSSRGDHMFFQGVWMLLNYVCFFQIL